MRSITGGALFALAGLIGAFLFEALIFLAAQSITGHQLLPRGAGWAVFPVVAAITGWRAGRRFDLNATIASALIGLDRLQSQTRLWVGFSAIWLLASSTFFFVFDPFGVYWWGPGEWLNCSFVSLGPVVIGFMALRVWAWANRAAPN